MKVCWSRKENLVMNLNEVVEWVRYANNPHNPDGKIKLLLVWKHESGWAVQPIYSTLKKSDLYKEIQLGQLFFNTTCLLVIPSVYSYTEDKHLKNIIVRNYSDRYNENKYIWKILKTSVDFC